MIEHRRHPDVFTDDEAIEYLHVSRIGTERTMANLRTEYKLPCFNIGKETLYHRVHLDALIEQLAGINIDRARQMKMAQG